MICLVLKVDDDKPSRESPGFVSDDMVCLATNIVKSSHNGDVLLEILNNLPYGLFTTDEHNRINYFNAAAEQITGIPASEAIGMYCRDAFRSDICSEDCTLDKLSPSGANIYIREFYITRADGRTFPIICTTCALTDQEGATLNKRMYVFKDIVDRKRLEDDLRISENKYRRIFEGSKDMIFITSRDGAFKDANQACVDLLGYGSKEELLSLESVEKVYSNPMHWKVFQEQIDRHGFIKDFEASFQKRDGTPIHCLMSGNAFRGVNGEVIGYEGIAKDITARMDGIRHLQEQHRKLSLLHAVAVAMNATQHLDDTLMVALKKVLDVLGLRSGGVFLIDHEKSGFSLRVHQGLPRATGGSMHQIQLHDKALMRFLLKGDLDLKPQRAFPPFRATLKGSGDGDGMELTCFLITRKERASGFFALEVPPNRRISEQDHRMMGSLGNFLGSAIENSRLLQTVHQHREELKRLTARLFHSQEEERKRIARELHDEAGQALTGINFTIETITKSLPEGLEYIRDQMTDIKKQISRTYQEMRSMSYRLHPAVLSDLGLEPALESYLNDISKYSGLDVIFRMVGFDKRLDPEIETVLYRISQEVITNTLKHSGAEVFRLSIIRSFPHIIFLAEDDGVGFDQSQLNEPIQTLGLLGIRERVAMLGGTFSLRSYKGKGTKIRIEIPIKETPGE